MKKIEEAQRYLREIGADGWLIYDFHGTNDLALRFLEIVPTSRRLVYWIPAHGEPIRLVHAIEPHVLDAWTGDLRKYHSWQTYHKELGLILRGVKKVAMEYSPSIPYVSKVDGGTVDLVRSFGIEVISSGAFLPHFTAVLSVKQRESQLRAGNALHLIVGSVWQWMAKHMREGKPITDYDVQQKILREFERENLTSEESPIVAVNQCSADPHYAPSELHPVMIRRGDFILIDLWAKLKEPQSVYADITRVAYAGEHPTAKQQEVFSIVRGAQRAATDFVRRRFEQKKVVYGFEVDDYAREIIREAGYERYFIHRTGHSIDTSLHGSGANMDNLEMHDDRPILPLTSFSIEPGIYIPNEFGIRQEYDLFIHENGKVEIIGGEQDAIVCLSL